MAPADRAEGGDKRCTIELVQQAPLEEKKNNIIILFFSQLAARVLWCSIAELYILTILLWERLEPAP
jgi:hypothetical protein